MDAHVQDCGPVIDRTSAPMKVRRRPGSDKTPGANRGQRQRWPAPAPPILLPARRFYFVEVRKIAPIRELELLHPSAFQIG